MVNPGTNKGDNTKTSFNPFATDGTQKYRLEKFLILIWKERDAQIPIYEALAG